MARYKSIFECMVDDVMDGLSESAVLHYYYFVPDYMYHYQSEIPATTLGRNRLSEVSPPGFERVVKALKRKKKVSNPWALAWWMKKKGFRPTRKG